MDKSSLSNHPTRRKALTMLAVTAGGGTFLTAQMFGLIRPAAAQSGRLITDAGVCAIMPETTEGPFYFDPELLRADIAEGKAGVPLSLSLQVVDQACAPIAGARVDVWHCDADGVYSGYPGQPGGLDTSGQRFLRGTQMADANGIAQFSTIYPGWYPGRTPHVHFKAFPTENSVMTGQLFFPDETSRQIYSSFHPYAGRPLDDATFNDRDGIARRAGPVAVSEVVRSGEDLQAALVIAVDPSG